MSDSKEYVSRSDELGNIHIAEEVLAAISAAAALEVGRGQQSGRQFGKRHCRAAWKEKPGQGRAG